MRKGFSLIEVLVVIAIIGILSSVVLATLHKKRCMDRGDCEKYEISCDSFRDRSISEIPVRCASYFNVDKTHGE